MSNQGNDTYNPLGKTPDGFSYDGKPSLIKQDGLIGNLIKTRITPGEIECSKDSLTNVAEIKRGKLTISLSLDEISKLIKIRWDLPTNRVLAVTIYFFTRSPDKRIEFNIKEYMDLCNIKCPKLANQQIDEGLKILHATTLDYQHASNRKYDKFRLNIISYSNVDCGNVTIKLNEEFYDMLAASNFPVMPFDTRMLGYNSRKNPNSMPLHWKLLTHKNMNYSERNSNIISVVALLNSSPYLEDYKKERRFNQLITEPFERDMNEISDISGMEYVYCDSKGNELSDAELAVTTRKSFLARYVKFEIVDYPSRPKKSKKKEQAKIH